MDLKYKKFLIAALLSFALVGCNSPESQSNSMEEVAAEAELSSDDYIVHDDGVIEIKAPEGIKAEETDTIAGNQPLAANERAVSRDTYEGDWPFTAYSGTLGCIDKAAYFNAGNETYALSGFSRAYSDSKGLGWLPVAPEQPFWLDNPDIAGTKISVGNMISDALKLCGD